MSSAAVVRIETPEGVSLPLTIAGPLSRALALSIDTALTLAVSSVIGQLTGLLKLVSPDAANALGVAAYFVVSIGYGLALEWFWRGQTVGKRALRLRVMDAHGQRLRFEQVVIRNALRFVDMLPFLYLVGGIASILSGLHQRLGDLAAGTIVVRLPSVTLPALQPSGRGRYNSLLACDAPVSRLRSRVTPVAAALAVEALERREALDPPARVLLFTELAGYFRSIAAFPEEVTAPLSNEQYVRNIVEIVAGGSARS